MKLYEIPIYAFTEKELRDRLEKYKESLHKDEFISNKDILDKAIELETFPYRFWSHNHIVGYVDVFLENQDVVFEVYLPCPMIKRYRWLRKSKVLLRNILANGTHFCIKSTMTNSDIANAILEMLNWIIKEHVPKRFYVDRRSFDSIYNYVDYNEILSKMK
jgi:hypothetical protein